MSADKAGCSAGVGSLSVSVYRTLHCCESIHFMCMFLYEYRSTLCMYIVRTVVQLIPIIALDMSKQLPVPDDAIPSRYEPCTRLDDVAQDHNNQLSLSMSQ